MNQVDLEDRARIAEARCKEARFVYRDWLLALGGTSLLVLVIVWTYGAIFALFGLVPAIIAVVAWRARKDRDAAVEKMYAAAARYEAHLEGERDRLMSRVTAHVAFKANGAIDTKDVA